MNKEYKFWIGSGKNYNFLSELSRYKALHMGTSAEPSINKALEEIRKVTGAINESLGLIQKVQALHRQKDSQPVPGVTFHAPQAPEGVYGKATHILTEAGKKIEGVVEGLEVSPLSSLKLTK